MEERVRRERRSRWREVSWRSREEGELLRLYGGVGWRCEGVGVYYNHKHSPHPIHLQCTITFWVHP